ncbi:MAG: hypothetical protein J7L54_04910, partial [Elusimicrobia bacterium]|nr:hypothetical protein [Elusimicrobiota bacterium]
MRTVFFTSLCEFPEKAAERIEDLRPVGIVSCEDFSAAAKDKLKEKGIRFFSPQNLKEKHFIGEIRRLNPELFVIVYFGKILPSEILSIPPKGALNIHFSLLPKYRGPAPVEWAVFNGEKKTGITLFFVNEKADEGDIIISRQYGIDPGEAASDV